MIGVSAIKTLPTSAPFFLSLSSCLCSQRKKKKQTLKAKLKITPNCVLCFLWEMPRSESVGSASAAAGVTVGVAWSDTVPTPPAQHIKEAAAGAHTLKCAHTHMAAASLSPSNCHCEMLTRVCTVQIYGGKHPNGRLQRHTSECCEFYCRRQSQSQPSHFYCGARQKLSRWHCIHPGAVKVLLGGCVIATRVIGESYQDLCPPQKMQGYELIMRHGVNQ